MAEAGRRTQIAVQESAGEDRISVALISSVALAGFSTQGLLI